MLNCFLIFFDRAKQLYHPAHECLFMGSAWINQNTLWNDCPATTVCSVQPVWQACITIVLSHMLCTYCMLHFCFLTALFLWTTVEVIRTQLRQGLTVTRFLFSVEKLWHSILILRLDEVIYAINLNHINIFIFQEMSKAMYVLAKGAIAVELCNE